MLFVCLVRIVTTLNALIIFHIVLIYSVNHVTLYFEVGEKMITAFDDALVSCVLLKCNDRSIFDYHLWSFDDENTDNCMIYVRLKVNFIFQYLWQQLRNLQATKKNVQRFPCSTTIIIAPPLF